MFRYLPLVALLSSLNAFADVSLNFGGEGNELQSKMHVFVNKSEPNLRCVCSRFSVAIDDGEVLLGATRSQEVLVVARDAEGKVLEGSTRSLEPIWRHPSSPTVTESQFVIMGHEGFAPDTSVQVIALKRKCMNPTESECNQKEIAHYAEFKASQLFGLKPILASDLKKGSN